MSAMMARWLEQAQAGGASDLHLTVGAPPMLRVDGRLRPLGGGILTSEETERYAREVLGGEFSRLSEMGDVDTALDWVGPEGGDAHRIRVNVYRQRMGISLAIRLVPDVIPKLDSLGLPAVVRTMVDQPYGLVLVTGPTGSGKTTTLAALIDEMNDRFDRHIITLEDPIEYVHVHRRCLIEQREVGKDVPDFSRGLRAALRQDPDVILVGEMRDLETIQTAITAAETGHLVLGTLHTGDAVQTVDRLIDVFPAHQQQQIRTQLAAILRVVIAQRLVRRIGGAGRVPLAEVLINTPAVANLIRSDKTHQLHTVMQTGRSQGMQTFDMHVRELVSGGVIDQEEGRLAVFGDRIDRFGG
ncbi:Twitching mobility protein [Kyrpidia spormannii]|uniref:Twitching mobility protein n=3 Tax=Kyrpidia spormannii TaxID=2055160 RepID=A0ACA8Z7E4_9BACL|nr:Twitching mobility protein [Kyrpidia spormannii]CAB3391901.1 Twitching mobility protein [Kyrpidia spormannii]